MTIITEELKVIEDIVINGLEKGADVRKWSIEKHGLAETIKDLMRSYKQCIALLASIFQHATGEEDSCKSDDWLMSLTRQVIEDGKKYRFLRMVIVDAMNDVAKPIAGGCAQSLHEKRYDERLSKFYWAIKNWMKEHDSDRIK